jgi:hypothetical protein
MRGWAPVLLGLVAISGIHAQTKTKHIQQRFPPDENPQYFPVGLFSEIPGLNEVRARWYASVLRGLEEPSLWSATTKAGEAVYRFTVIPAFAAPFAVRLVVDPDGTGTLIAKWKVREAGAKTGRLEQESLSVGGEQVKQFVELLGDADFWLLSTERPAQGRDGQEWLLEGKENGEYHVVDRWNGVMEDGYYNACQYIYKLGLSTTN